MENFLNNVLSGNFQKAKEQVRLELAQKLSSRIEEITSEISNEIFYEELEESKKEKNFDFHINKALDLHNEYTGSDNPRKGTKEMIKFHIKNADKASDRDFYDKTNPTEVSSRHTLGLLRKVYGMEKTQAAFNKNFTKMTEYPSHLNNSFEPEISELDSIYEAKKSKKKKELKKQLKYNRMAAEFAKLDQEV